MLCGFGMATRRGNLVRHAVCGSAAGSDALRILRLTLRWFHPPWPFEDEKLAHIVLGSYRTSLEPWPLESRFTGGLPFSCQERISSEAMCYKKASTESIRGSQDGFAALVSGLPFVGIRFDEVSSPCIGLYPYSSYQTTCLLDPLQSSSMPLPTH